MPDIYIKENKGPINNYCTPKPGRPPSDESMDAELKARVSDSDLNAVMAFCRGRKISRSDYIRHLISLDTEYFDIIHLLNDPELKELILHVLKVAKKF